jgi:hypothetical protein
MNIKLLLKTDINLKCLESDQAFASSETWILNTDVEAPAYYLAK